MHLLDSSNDSFEIDVPDNLKPTVERQLTGTTKLDQEIGNLPIPEKTGIIKISVILLRWYQKEISPKLGNRCVFDPSCSHYCELSIRNLGFTRGVFYTLKRLYHCRPGNGGIDMPKLKGEI